MRRQQQTLEKLRSENENLKTDLATLQARTTLKPLNSFEQSQLDKVSLETERYKQLIEVEKSKQSTMERQISTLREKIWNQRRKMGGSNAASENQRSVEKQVKMLENKLDQAVVKFNKSLSTNRKLREEIDNLRGERVAFEGVYKKLEKVRSGFINYCMLHSLYLTRLCITLLIEFARKKEENGPSDRAIQLSI